MASSTIVEWCSQVLARFGSPSRSTVYSLACPVRTQAEPGCNSEVLGADVVLTSDTTMQKEPVKLEYVVNYDTSDGQRNSRHEEWLV
jgi:hypothetical protein